MLDTVFKIEHLPSRSEVRNYCKHQIISSEHVEDLVKFNNKVLGDAMIWIEGYAVGVGSNNFQGFVIPAEVKEFYLQKVFKYVLKRIVE